MAESRAVRQRGGRVLRSALVNFLQEIQGNTKESATAINVVDSFDASILVLEYEFLIRYTF